MERKDLLSLEFYKRSPFTGSIGPLRYRIEKISLPIEGSEDTETKLLATTWSTPFAFAKTPEDEKTTFTADFSEDGMEAIADWINSQA